MHIWTISTKAITFVGRPKMKRDAGVNAVFLLRKKTSLTPASLFIFGRRTEVTLLDKMSKVFVNKTKKLKTF